VDELGRRPHDLRRHGATSARTSRSAYSAVGILQEGRKLEVEYFGETYPVEVAAVGYRPLYDPENLKPRS